MSAGPVVVNALRRGFYLDSVALMRLSVRIAAAPGVEDASLMMATPANLDILAGAGLLGDEGRGGGPDDLVIAVRAGDGEAARAAVEAALAALERRPDGGGGGGGATGWRPRTVEGARAALPGASLALVSVPGEHAALEAHRALAAGLDAMIFSDNVPVADEVALKRRAARAGRLLMGPDCGTAILSGAALGFANAVPAGDVGIVAASGTGLQELSVLLARGGAGVSHGIGIGGRDLGAEVGGLGALGAIERLAADPATARIALVSKPPDEAVAARVLERLGASGKPALACLLGAPAGERHGVAVVGTLHAAAEALLGAPVGAEFDAGAVAAAAPGRRAGAVRGLFSGGTLCAEAQVVLLGRGLEVRSNAPVPGAGRAAAAEPWPDGHLLLDLGADELTRGRPHPMLEPAVRDAALGAALADPRTGAVLLDVVLGHGAHPDPAGVLAAALAGAPADRPPVVASLCGVEGDPQGLEAQRERLAAAGVLVAPSTALAAALAAALAGAGPAPGAGA